MKKSAKKSPAGADILIGVDFDNTLVNYDEIMYISSLQKGLISPDTAKNKKEIRDTIRLLPDGEIEWQKLQAEVYGPRMDGAELIDGVPAFFEFCKTNNLAVRIVSHKTEFANYDRTGTSLREASLQWMRKNGFFMPDGLALSESSVFFESTRAEKIGRIIELGCTHFIDDLEELFLEESFPGDVKKILYAPHGYKQAPADVRAAASWQEITGYFRGLLKR